LLTMEGIIVNFRGGRHTQSSNQMIAKVTGVDKKEDAEKLVGKKAVWKSPAGKELKGEIKAAHGNKGAVRIIFETGMPGQSVSGKISIQ